MMRGVLAVLVFGVGFYVALAAMVGLFKVFGGVVAVAAVVWLIGLIGARYRLPGRS